MESFADFLWAMLVIYFWFMVIWIFIRVFADIFRRHDLSGGWKVIWILAIVLVPFLGALVYIVTRPRTAQDFAAGPGEPQAPAVPYSTADEITKLTQLRDSGAITPAEFDAAKAKALA